MFYSKLFNLSVVIDCCIFKFISFACTQFCTKCFDFMFGILDCIIFECLNSTYMWFVA